MKGAPHNDNGLQPPPNGGGAQGVAVPATWEDEGAAGARRAGDELAAAAAPSDDDWRWAPRPKPDPLTQEPEIGWQAARQLQRKRRQALAGAKNFRPRSVKDAGPGAFIVGRALNESAIELARQACPIEQAALALRRRGRIVYRMSVHGGSRDLWFVSGIGNDLSAADLIVAARKVAA